MSGKPKLLTPDKKSKWIDRAAMMALQGLLASDPEGCLSPEKAAELAYRGAKALWSERLNNG